MKIINKNLNWREKHFKTDLDDEITPLCCAAFLGRIRITELLLENALIDINMATEENEYTPLCAACMAGNFEIVKLLAENVSIFIFFLTFYSFKGADTNF
jgi:ankyrin repeat protein